MVSTEKSIEARIASNFGEFERLAETAEAYAAKGDFTSAAVYAQSAAEFTIWNHTGLFASPRLERMLIEIGTKVVSRSAGISRRAVRKHPVNVLHVLTQAYTIGGHTRLVWRWIQRDANRRHSVVFTGQGARAVPKKLVDAVRDSRGEVVQLDTRVGGPVSWARVLRRLALRYDQIVLHIHPADIVALMAFSDGSGLPPIIFLNHSDHLFWLGVAISDVVVHLRESATTLSRRLRGVEEERCIVMPIPIDCPERKLTRAEAKAKLGLPDDAIVLLTAAAKFKYEPILAETSYVDALLPILAAHEQAHLLVVGPDAHGQWERGVRESGGRLQALGLQTDMSALYQAADIYLDSHPVGSLTSLLEAGSYGTPLVSFGLGPDETDMLKFDCPGFVTTLIRAESLASMRTEVTRLIRDVKFRERIGIATRQAILDANDGPNWLSRLVEIYELACSLPPAVRAPKGMDSLHVAPRDIRLAAMYGQPALLHDTNRILRESACLLQTSLRLKLWATRFQCRMQLLPYFLLPNWAQNTLRRWKFRIAAI
jgi:hypothetical protein